MICHVSLFPDSIFGKLRNIEGEAICQNNIMIYSFNIEISFLKNAPTLEERSLHQSTSRDDKKK